MKLQYLRVGETYQTSWGSDKRFRWKLLAFNRAGTVTVQRSDRPRITFEVPSADFASLVDPLPKDQETE